jgi:hypothetical protein
MNIINCWLLQAHIPSVTSRVQGELLNRVENLKNSNSMVFLIKKQFIMQLFLAGV